MTTIDGFRRTLDSVARHPRALEVFGAAGHRFELGPVVTNTELQDVEERLRCRLPNQYRTFLLEVGNGGAGPGYGLWPLGKWDPTNRRVEPIGPPAWPDKPGQTFPHSEPWNLFYHAAGTAPAPESTDKDNDEFLDRLDEAAWAPGNADGALPVADLGCAIRLLLIVAGPERGHIWIDDRASDAGIYPASLPGSSRLTFIDVYDDWLRRAADFCQTGTRARSLC